MICFCLCIFTYIRSCHWLLCLNTTKCFLRNLWLATEWLSEVTLYCTFPWSFIHIYTDLISIRETHQVISQVRTHVLVLLNEIIGLSSISFHGWLLHIIQTCDQMSLPQGSLPTDLIKYTPRHPLFNTWHCFIIL